MAVEQQPAVPAAERLGERHLGLAEVVGQSIGFVGPVFSAAFLITLIAGANAAGRGGGVVAPLAIIFAAIGIAGLGWVIAAYARRFAAAGAIYEYVTYGLGRTIGNIAGWVYYGACVVLAVAIPLVFGGTVQGLLGLFGWNVNYWILGLCYVAVAGAVLYLGVRPSVRAQLALAGVSILFIIGFMIHVIIEAPTNSGAAFNPSNSLNGASGIFYGMLYAILIFVGFESAANLGEETDRPRRNVPLAIFVSLGLVSAYYVFVAYAQVAGFGFDVGKFLKSTGPFFDLAGNPSYGNTTLLKIMFIVVILDIFAVGLGTSVAATRGIFALGRDRRIPGVFARVDPRRGTPVTAIGLIVVLAVVSTLLVRFDHGILPLNGAPEWFPMFGWYAGFGGFCLACVYAFVCLSGVVGLRRTENVPALATAAAIGAAASVVAVYGSIYKVTGPNGWIWLAAVIWTAAGVAVTLWLAAAGRLHAPVALATDLHPEGPPPTRIETVPGEVV